VDDRVSHRLHHRDQVMSTGDAGPRLAVLFAYVEPEDTLDFAQGARQVLAPREVRGTPPKSGS
jgi:hypothetical protein